MTQPGQNSNGLKRQYTFEGLVIGKNNHVPAKACLEVVKAPGEAFNPLFLYGQAGGGKTHLMHAVANAMLRKKPNLKVRYISAERFMHEIIAAISEDKVLQVRDYYSDLDLWLLDDIQYLMESKTAQAEFFHIFNNLTEDNRQIILGSNVPPNKLTKLDKNILSRLASGLAAEIKIPDVTARMEILQMKEKKYKLSMSKEMLQYAAGMIRANVRELEGFLKKINAYVTLSHQELNMDLIQHVLKEILPDGMADQPPEELPTGAPIKKEPPPKETPPQVNEVNQLYQQAQGQEGPHPGAQASAPPPAPPKEGPPKPSKPLEVVMPNKPSEPPAPPPKPSTPPPAEEKAPPAPKKEAEASAAPSAKKEEGAKKEEIKAVEPIAPPDDLSDLEAPQEEENVPAGHKRIGAVFFYPAGSEDALKTVHQKFQDVIKKHKLKFQLKNVHSKSYDCNGKIEYSSFVDVCRKNKVPVAIVIGPPPTAFVPEQDFYDLLSVTLDVQGISLQLVSWSEINKDYRYLNLALDIALVRSR